MRVGLYVKAEISRVGGGVTFERQLVADLLNRAKHSDHEFIVFSPDKSPKLMSGEPILGAVRIKWLPLVRAFGGAKDVINRLFAKLLLLPHPFSHEGWLDRTLFRHNIEFFVNLTPSTLANEVPYLTCVWDLQHRLQPFFPEVSSCGRWARTESIYATILRRAACVVVLGPQGNKEVREFYGVPDERIRILTLPTPRFALEAANTPRASVPEKYCLQPGYFFYPAQFWPHKNHVAILWALKIIREKYSYSPVVAFVGSDGGNLDHVLSLARSLKVESQVRILGFVPEADLAALYQNALALVFPSMFGPENFPPLEAFALGCPVIASSVPGSESQFSDAALLFDPCDYAALAEAMNRIHESSELRSELVRKGNIRAAAYTGDDFARDILAILDHFVARRSCWPSDRRSSPGFSWKKLFHG